MSAKCMQNVCKAYGMCMALLALTFVALANRNRNSLLGSVDRAQWRKSKIRSSRLAMALR
jgi:heme exporter protein D